MAKTNYTFEKRQKEIAKKQKKEEKRQRKIALKAELPQSEGARLIADEAPGTDSADNEITAIKSGLTP